MREKNVKKSHTGESVASGEEDKFNGVLILIGFEHGTLIFDPEADV
jgi:hypothetical protein